MVQVQPGDRVVVTGNLEKSAAGMQGMVIEPPTETSPLRTAIYSWVCWDDGEFTWERTEALVQADDRLEKSVATSESDRRFCWHGTFEILSK